MWRAVIFPKTSNYNFTRREQIKTKDISLIGGLYLWLMWMLKWILRQLRIGWRLCYLNLHIIIKVPKCQRKDCVWHSENNWGYAGVHWDHKIKIVSIVTQKAFDSVSRTFMFETLSVLNLDPRSYIECINFKVIFNLSSVLNNVFCTGSFQVLRGVRQGDPLSAYLFIVCLEILAIKLHGDKGKSMNWCW